MILNKIKKGFSLVELIIYIAIIGMVITAYVSFVVSVSSVRVKAYVVQEVSENGRLALKTIVNDVKNADDIVLPIEGNTGSVLELNMPGTADNTIYDLTTDTLNQTIGAIVIPVTNSKVKVTNLQFDNLTKNGKKENVKMTMTIEYAIPGGVEYTYSQTFSTSVTLRK